MLTIFFHGMILAVGLILPLGVQNLFVFQQGMLQKRIFFALPAILTAAVCDTILIGAAVSGMSAVLWHFSMLRQLLLFTGILFLLYMGWITWRTANTEKVLLTDTVDVLPAKKQILFAASVSFFNPSAFLDIVGVIGTSSMQYEGLEKWIFSLAAISVSWLWFFLLGILGNYFHSLDEVGKLLPLLQKISSCFIWGTAAYMSFSLF